jgi:lipopolysaccharide export system ATP-binding protein
LTFVLDIKCDYLDRTNALWLHLARVYLAEPQTLIADEPFAGLDNAQTSKCMYILERIRDRGTGILITDHKPEAMLRCAQRIYIIQEGRIVYEDTSEAARLSAEAKQLYFRARV